MEKWIRVSLGGTDSFINVEHKGCIAKTLHLNTVQTPKPYDHMWLEQSESGNGF